MRLAVFGGQTSTSHHIVARALKTGYDLNVLINPTDQYPIKHENMSLMHGMLQDVQCVERAIQDAHAVIATLEHLAEEEAYAAMQTIVALMKKYDVTRLMLTLGERGRTDKTPHYVLRHSGLDWTIVRPLAAAKHARAARQAGKSMPASPGSTALFILSELLSISYIRKSVALSV